MMGEFNCVCCSFNKFQLSPHQSRVTVSAFSNISVYAAQRGGRTSQSSGFSRSGRICGLTSVRIVVRYFTRDNFIVIIEQHQECRVNCNRQFQVLNAKRED